MNNDEIYKYLYDDCDSDYDGGDDGIGGIGGGVGGGVGGVGGELDTQWIDEIETQMKVHFFTSFSTLLSADQVKVPFFTSSSMLLTKYTVSSFLYLVFHTAN